MSINLKEKNFKEEVLEKEGIVIVSFFADWCGPCKIESTMLEKFEKENKNTNIYKINVDDNHNICKQYGVMSIPTLLLFKYGKLVNKKVGLISEDELKEMIKE